MTEQPERYRQWIERTKNLYNGLKALRNDYPEALNWTDPILDTLVYIMFEERPSQNDWIEMALSSKRIMHCGKLMKQEFLDNGADLRKCVVCGVIQSVRPRAFEGLFYELAGKKGAG